MPCCLFEAEPRQVVFQVSADLKILAGLFYPLLAKYFDFIVMFLEEVVRILIVDETTVPA